MKMKVTSKTLDEIDIGVEEPVFTTGVVCKLLDIPIWVLKQLDKEGIVSPPREREGQSRLYSIKEYKLVKHCWFYIREHRVKITSLKVVLQVEAGNLRTPR